MNNINSRETFAKLQKMARYVVVDENVPRKLVDSGKYNNNIKLKEILDKEQQKPQKNK